MKKKILIVGGAGFIGINSARHFLNKGWEVIIFDNFSRKGTVENVAWLKKHYTAGFSIVKGDIVHQYVLLEKTVAGVDVVLHLAAQVAVTTSIFDPRKDLEINVIGTFNVLEAIRNAPKKPILLFSSTNKVYGSLPHLKVKPQAKRFVFTQKEAASFGVSENEPLDFHSPYGCSKGAADLYVLDYSRIYGLKTVVFRQSCVYGTYQFGVEDQGWIAWFSIATLFDKAMTLYGTGKQVRDILFIDDLTSLYEKAIEGIDKVNGQAFNVGGGPQNTLSLIELIAYLEKRLNKKVSATKGGVRAGDQPIFIADIRKIKKKLGWSPKVNVQQGLEKMITWIEAHQDVIRKHF